jgi:hypothetical protein
MKKITKTFKVVMLPSEKASQLGQFVDTKNLVFNSLSHKGIFRGANMALYIISDDEIKEGDWVYWSGVGEQPKISQIKGNCSFVDESPYYKKIVATTDKELQNIEIGFTPGFHNDACYKIPESFIQAYIKAYNESPIHGGGNTEVDLEMEQTKLYIKPEDMAQYNSKPKELQHPHTCNPNEIWSIKTRPDNTVIVHQSKLYSKTDLENAYNLGRQDKIASERTGEFINNLEDFINNL